MERSPTVVACGICCDSGTGAGNAYKAAFDPAGKHMRELGGCGIFDSPEHLSTVVGAARGFSSFPARLPRCARILFSALDEAFENFSFAGISPERIGVYAGTSVGGILESENAFAKILESGRETADSAFRYYECSTLAELVAKRIGARGECSTFSTACSSSSLALESACLAISEGRADAAVVCGADTLSRITVNGFGSLRLLSGGVCKPFDSSRDGINLGEAGGVIVVVAREFLGTRPALAEFLSFGSTCDAYHPTAPHPDGAGAKAALELCLDSSGLSAGDISYYCAHGTGTPANDSAETAVLRGVFGENSKIAFSSLKGVFGHTLGASGILNAIVAIRALSESAFPPSAGYSEGANPEPLKVPLADARAKVALSVSLGFGGNNSCAAIAKPKSFAGAPASAKYSGKIFVYGAGTACPNPDFAKIPLARENAELLSDGLLSDIPPLKKRKWAKLQRMFLQAARAAAQHAGVSVFGGRTCVSCSTGLGMVEQTRKFLESVISSRERTPLPTAFTNSVHNAPASALALFFKATGYNCSTTAKEISFEAALAEACARIRGACREWLSNGGFPEVVLSGGFPNAYLNGIYQQIYEGDIIARNGFENKFALRLLLKKTAEGVGRPLSFSRLQGIVSSAGARIGKATVIRYMESACEAFLLYPIRNFADKLVARETNPKYFFADNGILKLLARDPASAQFENAIALALLRRYGTDERVFFYEDDRATDVDFYIPEEETAIQACLRLDASDATSTRETAALLKLGNRLDCRRLLILTLEEERTIEDKGRKIEVMPLWKWLLGL